MELPERATIQSHTITVVPRYAETDKGGVIHHSVYPVWFEMGRTELLRANGVAYRDLEAQGVFFVVAELRIKYRRPAFYDEELLLETTCANVTPGKVEHTYRLTRRGTGLLLAEGSSVLACVTAEGKVRRVPEFLYPAAAQDRPNTSSSQSMAPGVSCQASINASAQSRLSSSQPGSSSSGGPSGEGSSPSR
jgi:acyl-CoA thioester hydrolase